MMTEHELDYHLERDLLFCQRCGLSFHSKPIQEPEFGGAVGRPAPTLTSVAPLMAWVLMCGENPIRWYSSELRAKQDLRLIIEVRGDDSDYSVHAVPRVE